MKIDQIFGVLLILLAIYLGVSATRGDLGGGLADNDTGTIELPEAPAPGNGGGGSGGGGGGNGGNGGQNNGNTNGGQNNNGGEPVFNDSGTNGQGQSGRSNNQQRSQSSGGEGAIANSDFCAGAPNRSQYNDLKAGHDDAVKCLEGANVITDTYMAGESRQFDPNEAVTRGQAAIAMTNMISAANRLKTDGTTLQSLPQTDTSQFKDGASQCEGQRAVARLNETPILQGRVDSRFEPCDRITRAQMASLIDRSYQYLNQAALPFGPDRFTDDDGSVHESSINAVAAADIMPGVSRTRFAPQRSVTRAELASYVSRVLVRMEDKGKITPL